MDELKRAVRAEQHKSVIAAVNKLAAAGKANATAVEAKVVALLHESKWDDAIATCGTSPALALHRAYALYKADRYADALGALDASPSEEEAALHLRAQVLFRLNRFDGCVGLYERVLEALEGDASSDPADVDDARLNLAAALVGAGRSQDLLASARFADVVDAVRRGGAALRALDAPYELVYNVACAFAEDGASGLAMRALAAAMVAGEALLREDGEAPEAIADELAVVRAQAAFLLQRGHYDEAAIALYEQVAASRPSDASVAATVSCNTAQLRGGRELLDVYKRLRVLGAAPGSSANGMGRMLRRQRLAVAFNRALLSYRVRRLEEASAALGEARAWAADMLGGEGGAADARAAEDVLARGEVLGAAIEALAAGAGAPADVSARLAALVAASPAAAGGSVSHALAARVQLLVDEGRLEEAADDLAAGVARGAAGAALPPAVAVTLAQLLLGAGRVGDALGALTSAIDGWTTRGSSGDGATEALVALLHARAAVRSLPSVMALGDAAGDYEALSRLPGLPRDQRAAAVACLAMVKAQQAATATAPTSKAGSGYSDADALLAEAAALAGPLAPASPSSRRGSISGGSPSSRRGSISGLAALSLLAPEAPDVDALEWAVAELRGAPSTPRGAAGSVAADASAGAAAAPAAKSAAVTAARKRRLLARRTRAREAYLSKLKASGKFDVMGIPAPDPERWLPKRERTYGRKGGRRKALAKSMNVSSGGAQGAAAGGLTELLTKELDAKAKADARKASGKDTGAPAAAPSATPPVMPKGAKKKGKR